MMWHRCIRGLNHVSTIVLNRTVRPTPFELRLEKMWWEEMISILNSYDGHGLHVAPKIEFHLYSYHVIVATEDPKFRIDMHAF